MLLSLLLLLVPTAGLRASGVIYVAPGGAGAHTGADWANALGLQTALQSAATGDQIWIKTGTYKPTTGADRAATFQLKSGVALYGGFAGAETSLDQRDLARHPSILCGDLLGNDSGEVAASNPTRSDNSYHVVSGSGTNNSAILDGFTITAGNANASYPNFSAYNGGGMLNEAGSPIIKHIIFSENTAISDGGGMANFHSSPRLSDVTFINNLAIVGAGLANEYDSAPMLSHVSFVGNNAVYGGGMANLDSNTPVISYAVFTNNLAGQAGGAIYNVGSSPIISNALFNSNVTMGLGGGVHNSQQSNSTFSQVTFINNTAASGGGGIRNDNSIPLIRNSIFWDNQGGQIQNANNATTDIQFALIQGGYITGTHILDADPLFVDADGADDRTGTADDDLRLQAGSPAIDAGSNAFIPADLTDDNNNSDVNEAAPFDLGGNPRLVNGIVDMGAYERQALAMPPQRVYLALVSR